MKIMITGATGFIGKKVLSALTSKYGSDSLICLSSQDIKGFNVIKHNNYSFDINYLSLNGCQNVDILIHIGAFIPKAAKDTNDIINTTSNITSTFTILSSNLPLLKKIIFISTVDVYSQVNDTLSESSLTCPQTMYGWSKLYCEKMIINHCKQNNLQYEILRLGHVYGEGEEAYRKVIPIMIGNAIEGNDLQIYGDGNAVRSYIYIDDVVSAIIQSIDICTDEIINIVGDEPVSVNLLAEIIKSFSDDNISIDHLPSSSPNYNYVFDNTKLKRYLITDLTPIKVGLKREYDYRKDLLKRAK